MPVPPKADEAVPESTQSRELDEQLDQTFPASDPPAMTQPGGGKHRAERVGQR